MPLYWLCYRHNNQVSVVIEPGASLIHARMRAARTWHGRDYTGNDMLATTQLSYLSSSPVALHGKFITT